MYQVIDTIGTTLTAFLKALSDISTWLTTPINFLGMGQFAPIQLFGVGLLALLGYTIIRSLLF